GAKIDGLDVAASPKIPEVNVMAVLVREQVLGDDTVLELRRQSPLARHHVVARQVPPEVVVLGLGSAIDLPAAEDVKRFAVDNEHSRWPLGAILAAATKSTHVDAFWPTVDRVRSRVTGFLEHLLGLDDLVNLGRGGIGPGIQDINARGTKPGDDQIAPLQECMAGERRQG